MLERLPCALCMIDGVFSESVDGWPGIPSCEAHVIACGGILEKPMGTVVNLADARARRAAGTISRPELAGGSGASHLSYLFGEATPK